MKKLALVLMLLILPFTVQAQGYETTTTLYCKMSDKIVESFILDGQWQAGPYPQNGWIVKTITQLENSIEVRLDNAEGETMYFKFNNGWPCKLITRQKPVQPESDDFTPVD